MALDIGIAIGLFIIFLLVLIGPFRVKIIEHNLEVFLFICGILALTISGFVHLVDKSGAVIETGWRLSIIEEALVAPVYISNSLHIAIGIVQVVLVIGLSIYKW